MWNHLRGRFHGRVGRTIVSVQFLFRYTNPRAGTHTRCTETPARTVPAKLRFGDCQFVSFGPIRPIPPNAAHSAQFGPIRPKQGGWGPGRIECGTVATAGSTAVA